MSPGGFFSGALGFGVLLDPPPQALTPSAAMAHTTAVARRCMAADHRRGGSTLGARRVKVRSNLVGIHARRRNVQRVASAILLVEDDDAIASGLARVLDGQGY